MNGYSVALVYSWCSGADQRIGFTTNIDTDGAFYLDFPKLEIGSITYIS